MACAVCSTIFSGERPALWSESEDPLRGFQTFQEAREFEAASVRPLHPEVLQMCYGALGGCQICDITWRHFFREKTPKEYISAPYFRRGLTVHNFRGSGTHYRLRNYELSGTELSEGTLEIEIALDSPIDQHITRYKTIILAPTEGK